MTLPKVTPHDHIEQRRFEIEERASADSLVCSACVTDRHLWTRVEQIAEDDTCTFCETRGRCVTFEVLFEPIAEALGTLYVTVDESGAYHDEGSWNVRTCDVGEILEDELLDDAVDGPVVLSLVAYVADRIAVDYGFVRRRDVWASLYDFDEGSWRHFMKQARDGQVNTAAEDLLRHLPTDVLDLFNRIEGYAVLQGLYKAQTPGLWRGRRGGLEDNLRSGREIGSAPAMYAASGRLNARGQSVFYGATELHGAIIEMTNHHGPDVELWCGRFTPSRSLYHLDVMTVPESPSPFAPGAADTLDAILFLRRFAETLREPKPARTKDEHDDDYWSRLDRHYLPTQIFTVFLLGTHEDLKPDAIKYGSSLDPASENWVVFADHEHCTDLTDAIIPKDDLHLNLDLETVRFVAARDYFDAVSGSDASSFLSWP